MHKLPRHSIGQKNSGKAVLSFAGIVLMLFVGMLSCVHDPLQPLDPGNGGNGGNGGNPIDTLDEEPIGIVCDPDTVYFEKDILPILRSNCAKSGCHDAQSHEDGVVLESYLQVLTTGDVRPFDLEDSDLYEVITESDPDKRMPPPPNQRLTSEQIALIAKWINQGAENYTCDANAGVCDTTQVTWSGFVAPLMVNYCNGCHSGTNPSGGINLTSHASAQTVALDGRLIGALTWATGFTPMPQGGNQLTDCQIAKIQTWIHEGAQNN